jgi:hypothetical protein
VGRRKRYWTFPFSCCSPSELSFLADQFRRFILLAWKHRFGGLRSTIFRAGVAFREKRLAGGRRLPPRFEASPHQVRSPFSRHDSFKMFIRAARTRSIEFCLTRVGYKATNLLSISFDTRRHLYSTRITFTITWYVA